jgi:hypothetical protein
MDTLNSGSGRSARPAFRDYVTMDIKALKA